MSDQEKWEAPQKDEDLDDCQGCLGAGWLDEFGRPYDPDRRDPCGISGECERCHGTGIAPRPKESK